MKILSFDVGGTKVAYALVDEQGSFLTQRKTVPTPDNLDELKCLFTDVIHDHDHEIDAVSFATAGAVDADNTHIVSSAHNMPAGYHHLDFASLSSKPVIVENDANAVAWAEHCAGAAMNCANAIIVAIGTGLGLGIIVDGKILKGKSGAAGEAHYPIDRGHKRLCGCGSYDCFEIYASGKALAMDAQEAFNNPQMTSHDLIKLKQENNAAAQQVFDSWCDDIIAGLRSLATLFDPEVIVLFGSLVAFLDEQKMETKANDNLVVPSFRLKKARFGNDAALVGAALLAVNKLGK